MLLRAMDSFVARKRPKRIPPVDLDGSEEFRGFPTENGGENESTDLKLATLASLFPNVDHVLLLDILIASDGSVERACKALSGPSGESPRQKPTIGVGYQTSLTGIKRTRAGPCVQPSMAKKTLTRKGQTLHLYTPEDIENHTPCSIIHNFLPAKVAEDLLKEL